VADEEQGGGAVTVAHGVLAAALSSTDGRRWSRPDPRAVGPGVGLDLVRSNAVVWPGLLAGRQILEGAAEVDGRCDALRASSASLEYADGGPTRLLTRRPACDVSSTTELLRQQPDVAPGVRVVPG
jgi:hypothetical protein